MCSVPVGDPRDSCFCLHWKETPPSTTSVTMAVRQDPTLLSSVMTFHLMLFRMTGEVEQILCMFENLQGGILMGGQRGKIHWSALLPIFKEGSKHLSRGKWPSRALLNESLHTGLDPGDGCQYKCGGCSDWCYY